MRVRSPKRTVARLAVCQMLLLSNGVLMAAVGALAGYALAPSPRLATVPAVAYVLGAAISTLPASLFMKRHGRRAGFLVGSILGMAGGAVGAIAIAVHSFTLLLAGTFLCGIYNAFGQYYRFAAADAAPPDWKSRAISLTLAGGIFGGFIGSAVGRVTRDLVEPQFLASYAALAVFALASFVIAAGLSFPEQSPEERHGTGRPLGVILRQPAVVVAVLAAAVGYGVMNLLMSVTPLAMDLCCGHPFADATFVLQWHVVGMFAPSFFTGGLIRRLGVLNVLLAGAALMFVCVAIAMSGVTLMHFWWALTLLGVGWNFLYIGGTMLLTEAHRPAEKAKVQGVNDSLVFAVMVSSSLTSGVVVTGSGGWAMLTRLTVPFLALTALATSILWFRERRNMARG
ncbi:MAG: MFS transporter [Candidatus Rokubacteria bacterium]|nr:MFS transporter [Candidatus Rokubacteria bacterium]